MIAVWGIAGLEILVQMITELGIFLCSCGNLVKTGKIKKYALLLFIFSNWLIGTYNATMCLFSIWITWFHVIMESIWLWRWSGWTFKETLCWCTFCRWLCVVTKTPVLIISGLIQHKTVARVINHQSVWTAMLELSITVCLCLICWYYCSGKEKFLKETVKRQGYLLFLIGFCEYLSVSYLIDVLNVEFEVYALVMVVIMMIMFMAFMVIIIMYMQYRWNEREKQVILSRERILESNYATLEHEQENNRKNIHDHRHELDYLYHCFLEKDYKRGCAYIENRSREYQIWKNSEIWTGNTGIDYLINKVREETKEKQIPFTIKVDMIDLPLAEYDFFTILGNVLENAVEAAEKCDVEKRFIQLNLCMKNEMLMLYVENSYLQEPITKDGKFLTSKENNKMHGWGIEIVKSIVEQYEGQCSIEYDNFVFSLQIIFGVS